MTDERFADWKAGFTPDRAPVGVCFNRRLLSDLAEAERELADAEQAAEKEKAGRSLAGSPDVEALRGRVDDLMQQVKAQTKTFVFESVGRRAWSDLISKHPPTDDQKREFGDALDHNPDTFIPVALSASCRQPGLTEADAQWMADTLPLGTWNRIWAACLSVNVMGSRDPFGNGFDEALPSAQK